MRKPTYLTIPFDSVPDYGKHNLLLYNTPSPLVKTQTFSTKTRTARRYNHFIWTSSWSLVSYFSDTASSTTYNYGSGVGSSAEGASTMMSPLTNTTSGLSICSAGTTWFRLLIVVYMSLDQTIVDYDFISHWTCWTFNRTRSPYQCMSHLCAYGQDPLHWIIVYGHAYHDCDIACLAYFAHSGKINSCWENLQRRDLPINTSAGVKVVVILGAVRCRNINLANQQHSGSVPSILHRTFWTLVLPVRPTCSQTDV
jgi:hypothetical protein